MRLRQSIAALVFATAACFVSVDARATTPIHNNQTAVVAGDSLTAQNWYVPLEGQVNAALVPFPKTITAAPVAGGVTGTAVAGGVSGAGTTTTVPVVPTRWINSGIAGTTSDEILANMQGRIYQYNPDVLIIEIGTNEHPGVSGWSVAKSKANLESIITQTRARFPGIPIAILGLLTYDEQWSSGPPLAWSPVDADTDAMTAMQATVATEFTGVTYMEVRAPALIYESLNNTLNATTGILTLDGRHPNATGQTQMGNWTIGSFQVLP